MEIKFNSNLSHQNEAINAVRNLFRGNGKLKPKKSVYDERSINLEEVYYNDFNHDIFNDNLLNSKRFKENFLKARKESGFDVEGIDLDDIVLDSPHFNIEMETGTGKTYVYLKTILELNKEYGFNKFIIVVPSNAIKAGVKKTLDITKEHFKNSYSDIDYSYFVYDSNNLTRLRDFATDDNVQIMIITIQSFQQKRNIIRNESEYGIIPFNYLGITNPIVIIDEPQTTISSNNRKNAVKDLNPLFSLHYSATLKDKTNLIYELDPIKAYKKHLVKEIIVEAFDNADYQNKAYIHLLETKINNKGVRSAKLMVLENTNNGLVKKEKTVKIGDKLNIKTKNEVYDDYEVKDISIVDKDEYILFTNNEKISLRQRINDINQDAIRQLQLEALIRKHLDKELYLAEKNIKVISLIFIDEVKNYRSYDENNKRQKGKYAIWFEKIYNKIIKEEKYEKLPKYIKNYNANEVHDGYFAIDKGKEVNSEEHDDINNDTYKKIMTDKEKLLNPKDNLRFIFSHSTLQEGWDNPNVFQICTFIETKSDLSKRQKIGRGLRLCVDGKGNRIDSTYGEEFETINRLTVLANESFESFADNLQKEMINEGIDFSIIHEDDFKGLEYGNNGENTEITLKDSKKIFKTLVKQGIIDKKGKINTKSFKNAMEKDNISFGEYYPIKEQIINIIREKLPSSYIKNEKAGIKVTLNEDKLNSEEFNNIWNKIKYKTYFQIKLDTTELIENCINDMNTKLKSISKNKITHTTTKLTMNNKISGTNKDSHNYVISSNENEVWDIVTKLQEKTHLTRETIITILLKSDEKDKTFDKLFINPTEYYNITLECIKDNLKPLMIKEIEYVKINDENTEYDKSKFIKSFISYVDNNKLVKSSKSIYDYIKCDSKETEVNFAKELESNDKVKIFIKLPDWFLIDTPWSHYNPDWAITLNINGKEETYFVIETKSEYKEDKRRGFENDKIECGRKHFDVLDDVEYDCFVSCEDFFKAYATENKKIL